ncbi:MAG: T9SS type A sorting domain-containing protein [Candidatus Zixiibacteriota bacterium]
MRALRIIAALALVLSIFAMEIEIVQVTEGPPACYEIRVINDSGDMATPITDFHFSVDMPGSITPEVMLPEGWELRYALPNSFLEADATDGHEIGPGETGSFIVCIDGPVEDLGYTLYFTGPDGVIPDSERSGPLGPLSIDEKNIDEEEILYISPNPFDNACNIHIDDRWNVKILDIQGKCIEDLGKGSVRWTPSAEVMEGVYFIEATYGERVIVKRVAFFR